MALHKLIDLIGKSDVTVCNGYEIDEVKLDYARPDRQLLSCGDDLIASIREDLQVEVSADGTVSPVTIGEDTYHFEFKVLVPYIPE